MTSMIVSDWHMLMLAVIKLLANAMSGRFRRLNGWYVIWLIFFLYGPYFRWNGNSGNSFRILPNAIQLS